MITRARYQSVFDLAKEVDDWAERPVAPPFADPQVHMSRSRVPQPFFLICAKDTILMQISGTAEAQLRYSGMHHTRLEMGDMLYVPAGTPCRIQPHEESIHFRYKAGKPGLEGVAWFCPDCDAEVWRYVFDAEAQAVQRGYLDGCQAFNADPALRTCGGCGSVHPAVDLTGCHWAEIADALAAEQAPPQS